MNPQTTYANSNIFWKVFLVGSLFMATNLGLLLVIINTARLLK